MNHFSFIGRRGIIEEQPFQVLWKEENHSRYHFDERHLEKAGSFDSRIRPYCKEV
ncbi:hypothetical protein [Lysinibacillus sp. LZ02]|uniref:hypothetical protein n=1 Tax=Lysinibacillus sp. LZ02 TaxID=3420668 RepID=UPI003D364541